MNQQRNILNLVTALIGFIFCMGVFFALSKARGADNPHVDAIHITWKWDLGEGGTASHGTELWASVYTNGFEPSVPWSQLDTNPPLSDLRFKIFDTSDPTATTGDTIIGPGVLYVAAYAYITNGPYTNGREFIKTRSVPSNIVTVNVPSPRRFLLIQETQTLPGPFSTTLTNTISLAGSADSFFRVVLEPKKEEEVPIATLTPPPPPLP